MMLASPSDAATFVDQKATGLPARFYLALASRIETHCHCYAVAQSPIVRHGNTVVNYLLRLPMPD